MADWKKGDPSVLEPEKCESWGWYDANRPPEPLFEMAALAFGARRTGQKYFDIPDRKT
ncbi:hypothetical protein L0Y41_02665 [bacterium]|nr:hypothetical protein [bacterium]